MWPQGRNWNKEATCQGILAEEAGMDFPLEPLERVGSADCLQPNETDFGLLASIIVIE